MAGTDVADRSAPDDERHTERHQDMRAALRRSAGGARLDRGFSGIAMSAGIIVLVVLGGIAVSTTREAWPAFAHEGLGFIFSTNWSPANGHFGAGALIFGTILVSLLALLIGVPLSLGIALFSTEMATPRMRRPLYLTMDLLAAVPSVVYGIWGINALGPLLDGVYSRIADVLGGIPVIGAVFGPPTSSRSFMTAGVILAVMIIPIVTSISREVILTVPSAQREAALALGATRWEMIRGAVLPWSRGGISGAVMLGLGRAMGETIAVALVIGNSARITAQVFGPGDAMAGLIANQWGEASGLHRSALIGLGVVLFVITIAVNLTATRIITHFNPEAS
jgi:phosphate transport system permease protein